MWVCFFCSLRSPSFFSFFLFVGCFGLWCRRSFLLVFLFCLNSKRKKNSFSAAQKVPSRKGSVGGTTALFFLSNSWTEGRRLPDEDETARRTQTRDRQTNKRTRTMGKINFETEVESVLSKQSATCDKLKIRVSDTVEGVSLSAKFVIPVNTSLSSKGADLSLGTSKVDLEAAKDFWKIKLDDVDQNTKSVTDVLKISVREKVDAIDSTATVEWKAKGNAVKAVLEPPVYEGVKSKLEFDNSKKQLTASASKKINKMDVAVKADGNVKTQQFKDAKMTISYPLPEGVKGSLEASTNGSGKITLKRGNVSAKMPLKNFTSAPDFGDVKLEFNYSTDIASF